ncbi:MAG TPA: IS1634 family transposase [Candidatus Onthousia excrementipullorum]|uniref:IS1634 family transposase n=1 Tax=Candidatus Onthousia excrementipullorum TaxID=2840884 RepID=A0A9D1J295_9FIRM|nr:IS1634 family transposase [Candidatus Onthousia excrementipullorum]
MFLKQSKSHNRIYLSFVQGYRDETGKIKHKTIKKIGYLDELEKQFDNPIEYFKNIAKEKNNNEITEYTIKNLNTKTIDENVNSKNLGYIVLKKIYKELQIDNFLSNEQKKLKMQYDLNKIFELLIFSRILFPASKNETFNNKDVFFEKFDFSLKDLYRSLDYFNDFKDDILKLIWDNTKDKYNRDTSISYYDTTNYYFEISYNDEDLIDENGTILEKGYRKKGPSKEHRKTPIISMGLLMDKIGIPLSYDLFPGNESEKLQMRPALNSTKAKYGIERTIIVADRGQNTSDNLVFIAGKNDDDHTNHDGYVYGQSIIGADMEFKTWAISQDGFINDYVYDEDGNLVTYKERIEDENGKLLRYEEKPVIFKHKSRVYAKKVKIKKDNKRKVNYTVYQKQMIYYSKQYADRQKHERENAIKKAKDLIENPGKYTQATSYGCTKYINNIRFDEETGEIPKGLELSLKLDKIKEEEKFDGYYSIVTSEKDLSDKEIRDIYKGLWKIEESFKITKSNLETRPVYVWTKEHIEAHFLTCFISLVIIRLLEYKTNRKYSTRKMIDSLKKFNSTNIEHDIYLQNFSNDVIKDFEEIFDVNLSRKYLTLSEIKKILNF